ncbi:U1 small nuclear ribonucleoprotein component Snu71p [[Candida] anglica]
MTELDGSKLVSLKVYGLPPLKNTLFSGLKPLPYLEKDEESPATDSPPIHGLTVPVFQNDAVLQVIRTNVAKIRSLGSSGLGNDTKDGKSIDEIVDKNDDTKINMNNDKEGLNGEYDENAMEIDSTGPIHFLDIRNFYPKNLKDQVTTVTIKNFPAVKKSALERILQLVTQSSFKWTMIDSDHIEHRLVFVRLDNVQKLSGFVDRLQSIGLDDLKIILDKSSNQYIDEKKMEEDNSLTTTVKKIVQNKKNYDRMGNSKGTEDLDAAMSYYSSYNVEPSELVDVPNDLKEGIIKDIIKFRSKVLKIEKERRKKEMEQERQNAKRNLKRLFEDIQETVNGETEDVEMIPSEESGTAVENSDAVNDYDDLTDQQYEDLMNRKRTQENEQQYSAEFKIMKESETFEKQTLLNKLSTLKNYENYLMENKAKFIENFKSFQDYNPQQPASSTLNTAKIRLYYSNHSEYLRIRTKERAHEEKLDSLDEKQDIEQQEVQPQPSTVGISISTKQSKAETEKPKSLPAITSIVISQLDKEVWDQINVKIGDLVEEYLGLREESLIEFISTFLMEKNLSDKEGLIEELSETLDDDANVVVEELWGFMTSFK